MKPLKFFPRLGAAAALLAGLTAGLTPGQAAQAQDVTLGVLSIKGVQDTIKSWKPLTDHLSAETGLNVTIKPLKFAELQAAVEGKQVDLYFANPLADYNLRKASGAAPLASLINTRSGEALNQFGGVIVVKADSDIQALADVAGRSLGCVKKRAFGGYKMQKRLLLENGVNPDTDCSSVKELGNHFKVVELVVKGLIDVGTVRTDTLEAMAAQGKLSLDDVRVLGEQPDGFPFLCSTPLYPEWSISALPEVPADQVEKIKAALLAIGSDSAPAKAGGFYGFSEPLDNTPVAELVAALEGK